MTQALESRQTTRGSQKERILALLREAGHHGGSNMRLNLVCFRYGARLHELRAEGHRIETIRISEQEFRFVLSDWQGRLF